MRRGCGKAMLARQVESRLIQNSFIVVYSTESGYNYLQSMQIIAAQGRDLIIKSVYVTAARYEIKKGNKFSPHLKNARASYCERSRLKRSASLKVAKLARRQR